MLSTNLKRLLWPSCALSMIKSVTKYLPRARTASSRLYRFSVWAQFSTEMQRKIIKKDSPTPTETCSPFGPPALLGQHKYTKMTAVTVAFQRATPDLPGMPTTPGRPRDVQVAPQPLLAPGSPVTPRTGGMLPFFIAV